MERAINWKLWGQKFFPASMKFHTKEWTKKYEATHQKCKFWNQKIFKEELNRHEEIWKTIPEYHKSTKGKVHTISSMESGKNGIPDSQGLYACRGCGRKFGAYRIATHENIWMTKMTKSRAAVGAKASSSSSVKVGKIPIHKTSKGKTCFKPFEGKGVKISSAFNPDQIPTMDATKVATFSGLKSKKKPYQPKITFNWRCDHWRIVNNIENKVCKKCTKKRDLTPEEEKAEKEEIEKLDSQKDDLNQIVLEMEEELDGQELKICAQKLKVILSNIIDSPKEEKYRSIKIENKKFHQTIGRYDIAMEFLQFIGFSKSIELDSKEEVLKYTPKEPSMLLKLAHDIIEDIFKTLQEEEEVKGEIR